ncbi:MAG: CHAD domain-containing protein [Myxococcaceae bacterium]|jgi:CHAD domain-containing protein|nr:CHAD domain-containing protein [Myxococcaceae bacterium]MCA3012081.1 CHAD domain-containing protein [Myxococcaceae bacterium]
MARPSLTPMLEHLRASVEAARATLAPEAVHQVRVASRRLRVFLTLAQVPVLRGDLRWLARALSRVRDLDVVLEAGVDASGPFSRWLRRQRVAAHREAARALAQPRVDGVLRALSTVAPLARRRALEQSQTLDGAVDEAWRGLRAAAPATVLEALHRLRRCARSARYAREWLGRDASAPRWVQEVAGPACDVIALSRLVREFEGEGAGRDSARLLAVVRARLLPHIVERGP